MPASRVSRTRTASVAMDDASDITTHAAAAAAAAVEINAALTSGWTGDSLMDALTYFVILIKFPEAIHDMVAK